MIVQTLIGEFEHEVNNTRKLLQAVPQKDLSFKPSSICWSMGELAQHIATIYYWYTGTLTQNEYDLAADKLERGDPRISKPRWRCSNPTWRRHVRRCNRQPMKASASNGR
ncbi:hypothetical protein MKQ70_15080 [Chitinophaga sedimenti]|uniref:hypothetical protein n=1 Tax=Chitinophaga sedimenti TaxID=2033606 RepID=UPI00200564E4|nr:hypothetical protein [Chitinophaga sedimenti]MCK7556268.1 hypothetical protein [Chitinophaga sedimenti]